MGELGFPYTAEDPPHNEVAELLSVSGGVDRYCVYREGSLFLARAVDEALQTPTFCGVEYDGVDVIGQWSKSCGCVACGEEEVSCER